MLKLTPHALLLLLSFSAVATDWPGWRGPTGSGTTDDAGLPLKWDGKTKENVMWKTPLPASTGHSSPIVWGEFVFVTTASKQTRAQEEAKEVPEHQIQCFAAGDGKPLWRTAIPPGTQTAGYAIYAVPTPATDGKRVYAWFGSAVLAAVDFDGNVVWRKERAGPFNLNPGLCSSPVLFGETVILLVDQGKGLGYLQGIDKATGEVKWEQKRAKMSHNNSTPLLIEVKGKQQLVVAGSNILQGLDPANGEPIWWCKSAGFGESPVFGSGLIYADKGLNEPAMAVDPGGTGDVTATHVKWQLPKVPGEYASAVISGDCVYKAAKPSEIICRNLRTGELVYSEHVAGLSIMASPIATPERVYFITAEKSHVIKSGPTYELLATNNLNGSNNHSSPAVSKGRIFLRDNDALYCIGKR